MQHIHKSYIIHGDIKLANIMIEPPMRIKLIDFGYSSYLTKLNEKVSSYSGTLVYMAPEVIRQTPYDGKAY